jgi:hypothetical protein
MKSTFLLFALTAGCSLPTLRAIDETFQAPDTIVLRDGKEVRGLIIKNTAHDVTLQERFSEITYPKSDISRIIDIPDRGTEYTDIDRKGDLPSWRVIVNDLRSNDKIKSFVEIPAVRVDVGVFRRVPYKSFRINETMEFNIYGDPENPAGIEFGIFGSRAKDTKLKKTLRAYLAGFLASRGEVAALYNIGLEKGEATAGNVTFEVTPTTAEDAFGAWWISLYNAKSIESVRLSEKAYDEITLPAGEVLEAGGRVKNKSWTKADLGHSSRLDDDADEVIQRGFYRDENGVFRFLGSSNP